MTDNTSLGDLPQPENEGTAHPDDLEVDGDNPNEMTDEQFGLLCDRMRQNGWLGGPIITTTEGLIADGEHRWRAAQEIGLSEVPVRQYDIDDAERRLWRQELNKIHGEHDSKRDALEYDYLLDAGKSDEVHELTKAADEDLDELLSEIKMEQSQPAQYEYDPEHNVYFEDCVEGMRERVDDNSVDMVFTSPPYNIKKDQGEDRTRKTISYSDELPEGEFKDFLREVAQELQRVIKENGHIFVNFGKTYDNDAVMQNYWIRELFDMPCKSVIVWDKKQESSQAFDTIRGRFYNAWEPIYHFTKSESPLETTKASDVWPVSTVSGNNPETNDIGEHPAPFPIDLVKKGIESTTTEGDVILDPFMGSGTTAVAAIQSNRDYVGFELDEEGAYKPIIERRIGEAKRQVNADVNTE